MAEEPTRPQLQQKAAELRKTIAKFDGADANHDHKLSGQEVADAVVKQWAADHAGEADPFKSINDRLKIVREGKAIDDARNGRDANTAAKFSGPDLEKAYTTMVNAKGQLYDMLEKVTGGLKQVLRFNAAEVGVTDEQQRAEQEAKTSRARQDAAAAAERRENVAGMRIPPEIAKQPQVAALLKQMATGEVSPEIRAQQEKLLAATAAKVEKDMRANLEAQAPAMAAGMVSNTEQQIAEARANAQKAMAGLPPEIQKQQMAAMEAVYAQMRTTAQQGMKQIPHAIDLAVGAAHQARVEGMREGVQGEKAKPPELNADAKREVQALQHKLAEYKPENITTPSLEELSAAIVKQTPSKTRER